MAFIDLFARLHPRRKPHTPRANHSPRRFSPATLETLEDRTSPAIFSFAAMGDSLTTHYSGARASSGDKSWVDQLNSVDGDKVSIYNVAGNGATSAGVAANQAPSVRELVADGTVHYTVLEIGGNDERAYLNDIVSGNAAPFIHEVVANIERALSTVASGGKVQQVLGLLPDIGGTPAIKAELHFDSTELSRLTQAVRAANEELLAYARSHGIAVADVYSLGKLTSKPIVLGGTPTTDWWSPDNFHPSGVLQGLFADVALRAFQSAYGVLTQSLRLSDQEILGLAGDGSSARAFAPSYYNLSRFVILPSAKVLPIEGFSSTTAPFYPNLDLLGARTGTPTRLLPLLAELAPNLTTSGAWHATAAAQTVSQTDQALAPVRQMLNSLPVAENTLSRKLNHFEAGLATEFHLAASGLGELPIPNLA
jgi:lysophospholipase L1-like esterase